MRLAGRRHVNLDTLHTQRSPHWSLSVDWRPGRWDPLTNAPVGGYPILHVRGRCEDGSIIDDMHYACGGGEEQPPFDGWFAPYKSGDGFYQVRPVEWQPLTAEPEAHAEGETAEATSPGMRA